MEAAQPTSASALAGGNSDSGGRGFVVDYFPGDGPGSYSSAFLRLSCFSLLKVYFILKGVAKIFGLMDDLKAGIPRTAYKVRFPTHDFSN